jgi:hypothetical protein
VVTVVFRTRTPAFTKFTLSNKTSEYGKAFRLAEATPLIALAPDPVRMLSPHVPMDVREPADKVIPCPVERLLVNRV